MNCSLNSTVEVLHGLHLLIGFVATCLVTHLRLFREELGLSMILIK